MSSITRHIVAVAVCNARDVTPLVVGVAGYKCTRLVGDANDVVLGILDVVIAVRVIVERPYTAVSVGVEVYVGAVTAR